MIKSNRSCWKLVLFVVSHCCNIPGGKDMYGILFATMEGRPGIQCVVSLEAFCIRNFCRDFEHGRTIEWL